MKFIKGLENYTPAAPAAVTIGKFDGLHRGHEFLTGRIVGKKREGLCSVVIIFDTSPRIALKKDPGSIRFLITKEERKLILEREGVEILLEIAFTEGMIHMEPEDFIRMLVEKLDMRYLAVGKDFRFGYHGRGDAALLHALSREYGFELDAVDKIRSGTREISSTYIREEIENGHIEHANELLGYAYFLWGEIVHGNHIGTGIGMPTINILPGEDKLLPPRGVYVTYTEFPDGSRYGGVTNVGIRPTIQETKKVVSVETHLLDFHEDVYGKRAKVSFLRFLRPEETFGSLEKLRMQMERDRQEAADFFAEK